MFNKAKDKVMVSLQAADMVIDGVGSVCAGGVAISKVNRSLVLASFLGVVAGVALGSKIVLGLAVGGMAATFVKGFREGMAMQNAVFNGVNTPIPNGQA